MPEPTAPDPATEPKAPILSLAHLFWGAGGILATLVATMMFNHSQVTSPAAPKAAAVPAPATPRTVQVVSLFDCQYITFSEPFFILHLPQCTNCIAKKK